MIHEISIENFYSFKGRSGFSFAVHGKVPDTEAYINAKNGVKVSKILAVFGANASGKTNVLRAIPFIKWFIEDSFSNKHDEEIPIKPFLFGESKNKLTRVSAIFEMDERIYSYIVSLNSSRVFFEELKVRGDKGKFSRLFKREWIAEDNNYSYALRNYRAPGKIQKIIRPNASLISTASQLRHELSLRIVDYWRKVETNVIEEGRISVANYQRAAKFFQKNPGLKKKADYILNGFDKGLEGVSIQEYTSADEEKPLFLPVGVHGRGRFELPFIYESAGTQNLFSMLPEILRVLEKGGIAVLDELDSDLHPMMVSAIVNWFKSKRSNPEGAQLLFSTHTLQELNELDRHQILLTEKNAKGASKVWHLSDVKNVRNDENYYAKYIAGAYGAIPKM